MSPSEKCFRTGSPSKTFSPLPFQVRAIQIALPGVFDHFSEPMGPGTRNITPLVDAVLYILTIESDNDWQSDNLRGKIPRLIPNEVRASPSCFRRTTSKNKIEREELPLSLLFARTSRSLCNLISSTVISRMPSEPAAPQQSYGVQRGSLSHGC
jgi:hypothetical protein